MSKLTFRRVLVGLGGASIATLALGPLGWMKARSSAI